ncbi:MAG: hypothetical protein DCC67_05390 [Planctomycetota bacterium]|nr:MAG: hypothetical protein DCC67_05390 [Planctomycetota bacterium]
MRRAIRRSPLCNWALRWIVPKYRKLAVSVDTEIVIEGYPRCANTFAVVAFRMAQPRDVPIAHHIHSLSQVRRGVRRRIPTLVLIRRPSEAILSYVIRKESADIGWALDEYVDFHRGLLALVDDVIIADFHEVTSDFGAVIRRVNQRFGSQFVEFDHTEENVEACYRQIDSIERFFAGGREVRATHVARPSEQRSQQKQAFAAELESPRFASRLAEAERLYDALRRASLSTECQHSARP